MQLRVFDGRWDSLDPFLVRLRALHPRKQLEWALAFPQQARKTVDCLVDKSKEMGLKSLEILSPHLSTPLSFSVGWAGRRRGGNRLGTFRAG